MMAAAAGLSFTAGIRLMLLDDWLCDAAADLP
jgi:hypothetical protein